MRHHSGAAGKSARPAAGPPCAAAGTGAVHGTHRAAGGAEAGRSPAKAAGLLLAAGAGRRLGGRPKALLPHRGGLLVEHAAQVLRDGGCSPVYVVLGAAAPRVRAAAAGLAGCRLVDNRDWAQGMGSSLRAGLEAVSLDAARDPAAAPRAVVVALVDQPWIVAEAVARLLAGGTDRSRLGAAAYGGRRGHPVLLGADHWAGAMAAAAGDRGARDYLDAHRGALALVECADIASPRDIDTPGDLRLLDQPGGTARSGPARRQGRA